MPPHSGCQSSPMRLAFITTWAKLTRTFSTICFKPNLASERAARSTSWQVCCSLWNRDTALLPWFYRGTTEGYRRQQRSRPRCPIRGLWRLRVRRWASARQCCAISAQSRRHIGPHTSMTRSMPSCWCACSFRRWSMLTIRIQLPTLHRRRPGRSDRYPTSGHALRATTGAFWRRGLLWTCSGRRYTATA